MAGAAVAAPLTPAQAEAVEQAASTMKVPFALPLGVLMYSLTGSGSTAGVTGTLPASPLAPPSAQRVQEQHQLVPDPLLAPLNTAHQTPSLDVSAPLPNGDGTAKDGALGLDLPSAPLKAVGSALSLGHPLNWSGLDQGTAPAAGACDRTRLDIDPGTLAPSLSSPQLQTAPGGRIDLNQGQAGRPLPEKVSDLLATLAATAQELKS